jgi:hypothetical protein
MNSPFIKCVQMDISCKAVLLGQVRLGKVRIVMFMRSVSGAMESLSFHFTTSSNRHVDIIERANLERLGSVSDTCAMTSLSFHFTTYSNRHVGITERWNLKSMRFE